MPVKALLLRLKSYSFNYYTEVKSNEKKKQITRTFK